VSPGHPGGEQDSRRAQHLRGEGPGFGYRLKAMLEDIATLTGGKMIA
jgi:hypothetical protein